MQRIGSISDRFSSANQRVRSVLPSTARSGAGQVQDAGDDAVQVEIGRGLGKIAAPPEQVGSQSKHSQPQSPIYQPGPKRIIPPGFEPVPVGVPPKSGDSPRQVPIAPAPSPVAVRSGEASSTSVPVVDE